MRKLFKAFILMNSMSLLLLCSGCGKDDKLVMVTTEKSTENVSIDEATKSDVQAAVATTEVPREEASEQDKAITIEQIYAANAGDEILKGGNSYKVTKQYRSNGQEALMEEYFLGFDTNGQYVQTFSTSDGYLQIADRLNRYWYVVENGVTSVLICPDQGGFDYAVDFQHNNMIFSGLGISGDELTISDVYRQNGELVVEMKDSKNEGYKYTLQDDYRVKTCDYSTEFGDVYCSDTVAKVDAYTLPKDVADCQAAVEQRQISLLYPYGDGMDDFYYISDGVEFKLTDTELKVYKDDNLMEYWEQDAVGEDGKYLETTLYLSK